MILDIVLTHEADELSDTSHEASLHHSWVLTKLGEKSLLKTLGSKQPYRFPTQVCKFR